MIKGAVNADLEAVVELLVVGINEETQAVRAVIDTGFSGFLTLPPSAVADLELDWICRQNGMLADGSIVVFDVFAADVVWDGVKREVEVEAADAGPLIGMLLLQNHRLTVDVSPGGKVSIEAAS